MSRRWTLALALLLAACPDNPRHREHDEKHGHAEHAAGTHKHKEEQTYDPGLATRVESRRCEHDKEVLECDDCRYEVGAVQVPASLLTGGKEQLIRTARVAEAPASGRLALTGEIAFDERKVVRISPLVAGVARRVPVTQGDRVKRGQLLAEIDSRELGLLRSRLQQARARLSLAKTEFERESRLFADKISSAKERSRAESDHKRAQIELQALEDQLRLLGLSSAQRGRQVGRIAVRSPLGGTVVAKHVVPGESVTPDKEIFTVAELETVWVWASVYERDLADLLRARAAGVLPAEVRVTAFPDRAFAGTVDYVGATMDEVTRTVKMRVAVENKGRLLRPGMFADLSIQLGEGRRELSIPAEAVLSDGDRRFVFVRTDKRRFLRRDVRVGRTRAGRVPVLDGLRDGEEIAVQGAFLLKSDVLREKMGAGCAD
jgi:cobalt-zinc-cadmium efflux system membrane fusion protein